MKDEIKSKREVINESPQASDERRQLYAERVKLLYTQAPLGLIATLVNSIILTFVLWEVVSHNVLMIWLTCLLLVTSARYVFVYRYRYASAEQLEPRRWDNWFTIGIASSGIIWGSAGIFLFPLESVQHQVFLAFVIGGMVAGAVGAFSVIKRIFLAYSLPTLLPINVQFFMQGGDIHVAMGLMLLLFMILMVATAGRINTATVSSLKLGFENTGLVKRLATKKEHVERLNEELESEIAQRRQAQEALQRSHQELEQRVMERTSKLRITNEQLRQEIEDRKRAVEALRESEERYRGLFENSTDFVYTLDLRGNFTNVNRAAKRLSGYTKAELIGMSYRDYMPSLAYSRMVRAFTRILKTGKPLQDYPLEVTVKDGNKKYFETSVTLLWEGGEMVGFQGSSRDITHRKRAEEALQKAHNELEMRVEERTAELLEKQSILRNQNISLVKKSIELSDVMRELEDKNYDLKLTRSDLQEAMEALQKAHEGLEQRVDERTAELTKANEQLKREIEDRRRAEEALRESEERYRNVYDTAPLAFVIWDRECNVTDWNDRAEQMFGWSREEVAGTNFFEFLIPEKARPRVEDVVENLLAGKVGPEVVNENLTKSGEIILCRWNNSILYDSEGNVIGAMSLALDITERKHLEAQLQQAQKMEAIGTLAGGIAHDFNNLLMGIQGRTSLMLTDVGSHHPHFVHLSGIEDMVKRGADLSKRLLGFARGGKYEIRATDLNILVGNSSEMFGRTKKEIKVHGKYQKDIWAVEVDQGQIEQVLLNLYVNAWQAMPGGGDLYLETRNVTLDKNFTEPFNMEPGNYVKLSVTDTGVGMDEATKHRVFEPFFSTKEIGGGTGLGLASAYGIIKNHGGLISVQSDLGHRTTFDIYLPASDQEVTGDEEPSVDILEGTETVLLVDDEDMILEVGKEMVATLGYNVMLAGSGKEAMELYKKNEDQIDMVILDMIMPDMGGGEVYDRLKEINPHIKVLLSSGYSIDGQANEILQRGCSGFIQKPFNIKQLSSKLRQILEIQ